MQSGCLRTLARRTFDEPNTSGFSCMPVVPTARPRFEAQSPRRAFSQVDPSFGKCIRMGSCNSFPALAPAPKRFDCVPAKTGVSSLFKSRHRMATANLSTSPSRRRRQSALPTRSTRSRCVRILLDKRDKPNIRRLRRRTNSSIGGLIRAPSSDESSTTLPHPGPDAENNPSSDSLGSAFLLCRQGTWQHRQPSNKRLKLTRPPVSFWPRQAAAT